MKGLTIFEVLVSVLIFSIIALGLGSAVVVGKGALSVSDIPTQLRQNVLFAIMSMSRELRQADAKESEITIVKGEPSDSIKFRIPHDNDVPPDGFVVDDIGDIEWSQYITYSCNGGQLMRTLGAGMPLMIAPNITSLKFNRLSGALIQIDITAQKSGNLDIEQAIVKMRNRS